MGPETGPRRMHVLAVGDAADQTERELAEIEDIDVSTTPNVESTFPLPTDVDCLVLAGADVEAAYGRLREHDDAFPAIVRVADTATLPEAVVRDPFVECCPVALDDEYVGSSVRSLVTHYRTHRDRMQKERALDQAPVGITISDPDQSDNPVVYANEGFHRLTGYGWSEVVGRNCRFLQGTDTDQETVDELRENIDAERRVEVDLLNYRADGSTFWNHLDVAPVHDEAGNLVNYIGYQKDVTDRVEAEQRLREQNERLEAVAEVMSHDIRNPLSIAQGHLELLRDGEAADVDVLDESLDRIATIVEDALVLASGDEADLEWVDLGAVAERAWETTDTGTIDLRVVDMGRVEADESLLRQLLENLYRNVREHAEASTVTVGPLTDGFFVADDGRGVPEAELENVFESGYTTAETGTGLGLTIVRRVADAHGWSLALTEGEEGGARVEVTDVRVDDGDGEAHLRDSN